MTFSALDSALVGPLFATEAMREVFSDRRRIAAMLAVEAALARAEARFGLAPAELAPAIEAIDPGTLDLAEIGAGTALAGVPAIPFVKAVQNRLPKELEPAFHKGSTTQDIVDSALVLQMRDAFVLLADDLRAVLIGLAALALDHRTTPCAGRSYGQQAQPVSFGFKVAVWAAGVAEVAETLPTVRKAALTISLAGPAGTLSGLREAGPAVADAVAHELGLGTAPIAWHVRRGRLAAAGCWLATLIGALAKMATDVADLASTEVAEVSEPHVPGRRGSSAMPHKRNPVSSTIILAAHGAAPNFAAMLVTAMAAQHERPAGAWHAEWHALPSLFGLASGALAEAKRLAEGLVPDPERMRANLELTKGLLYADAVAARLSGKLGRERAHAALESAAGRVRDGEGDLRTVLAADSVIASALGERDLAEAFDPTPAVAAAGGWVDRALQDVDRARDGLAR